MNLPEEVIILANKFAESNFHLYLVGGPVRDLKLGRTTKDWDFTTDATPEQVLEMFPQGFYANTFGTVVIPLKYLTNFAPVSERSNSKSDFTEEEFLELTGEVFDITIMRKESGYKDSRHPTEVEWTKDITEDLGRRDFTINAMAIDVTSGQLGELFDPYDGRIDLKEQLIKAVGDPSKRFNEDALRLMRGIRFATQLHFLFEENTFQAIKANAGLIKNISWERIRDELFKILAAEDPYRGIIMLRETGILQLIIPELERCFGVMQEGPKHDRIYDIGARTILYYHLKIALLKTL